MPRTVPSVLATHLAGCKTICYLLKVMPTRSGVDVFGLTTLDADITFDDGSGPITYRAANGYTAFDLDTRSDMSVDNSEASGLLAEYPADGVTAEGVARGDYDSARFVQYIVNYEDLTMGHIILNSGQVGQVTMIDDLTCKLELRSLAQILKQISIIELTSITCRAAFGDIRCKMPLLWYNATVDTVGDEPDRVFTVVNAPGLDVPPGTDTATVTGVQFFTGDGTTTIGQLKDTAGESISSGFTVSTIYLDGTAKTLTTDYTVGTDGTVTWITAPADGVTGTWDGTVTLRPDGYFVPGVVQWLTGDNTGRENEIEEYDSETGQITLVIPTYSDIASSDTFKVRRDCDKSKTMCIAYGNLLNMRAEPELPRADGTDLQSPTPGG